MDKLLLKPLEAAQVIGVSRSKLYELMTSGRIESVAIGRSRRVPAEAITMFVEELRRAGEPSGSGASGRMGEGLVPADPGGRRGSGQ